ncbi:tRNA (adenosine(37)-N6)-threonylcarbamoyltransferase complex ATPase subunit type 1 TsaE [Patescibacteria group bacterium]|nr:tRNA (adenosine(37)-N6)-threonylcarbamoyltransferase complex ATPase subunit type 1 TsaE [Patescibacteria group bacterium]
MEIFTNSAAETKKLAFNLAKKLKGGEVLALYGDLGSGKTTFVQGFVEGFGIKGRVQSPTFVFVRFYGKRPKIVHIDLYRINSLSELVDLGLEEFLGDKDTISLIEWPEKMEGYLPKKALKVEFKFVSENIRGITVL